MIETVYSNENGDTNHTCRVQSTFKMPKNIRQIGKSSDTKKIYVEDYVMTYIKQLAGEDYSKCRVAVLVGQYVKQDNCRNIFITGAIEVSEIDTNSEITFSNDIWTMIYENIKKYFVEAEIVGWFIGGPSYFFEDNSKIIKAHVDNFAGQDKTLLTYDNIEKEEAFLLYENNKLNKQEGYYIYYEKNEDMQNYMVEHNKGKSAEADYDDHVAREIRTIIQNKKPVEEDKKSVNRLMYAAGTLLAIIILVVGATMLNNYDQMKNMQETLNTLYDNIKEGEFTLAKDNVTPTATVKPNKGTIIDKEAAADKEGNLNVEVLPGNLNQSENNGSNSVTDVEADVDSDVDSDVGSDVASDRDTAADDSSQPPVQSDNSDETNALEVTEETDNNDSGSTAEDEEDHTSEATNNQQQGVEVKKYYTVKSGDTLAAISYNLYNTYSYVSIIKDLNNLANEDLIIEGQRLIVP